MKADFEKGTKVCSKCKRELPISEFNKNKNSKDGLYSYCRQCASERTSEYYKNNKEHIKTVVREYQRTEKGKEVAKRSNDKHHNTFNGTERSCRGKSHIVKRDYELTEEQLQKRER